MGVRIEDIPKLYAMLKSLLRIKISRVVKNIRDYYEENKF